METFPIALLIGVAFMGSGLITPLYDIYQRAFHFSEVTLTLIYAAYVVGNVAALLFFGKFSDRIGRRRVGMASILLGIVSVFFFLFAKSTLWLYVARVFSGVAVGLASGTGAAWLSDLSEDKTLATVIASVANGFGFALGPILAAAIAQYGRDPLHASFYAYLPFLVAAGVLVGRTRETVESKEPISLDLLRPRVGIPREIIGKFIAPAVTVFGTFALVGFYAALIPTILARSLRESQPIIGGAIVFELAFLAGVAAIVGRRLPSRVAMLATLGLLLPSVAGLMIAQIAHSMLALVLATAVGSLCWGLGYRGSLQVVNEIAPQGRRAEVASSYYIVGFIGNSIPVIGVGLISAAANATIASAVFGCTIGAFAVAALANELHRRASS
jgi:predicted MFS family arabinose efflux permease